MCHISTAVHVCFVNFHVQYNKQHILPLEDVKLQSLENDGRKLYSKPSFSYKVVLSKA